jgi:hypothetical protein
METAAGVGVEAGVGVGSVAGARVGVTMVRVGCCCCCGLSSSRSLPRPAPAPNALPTPLPRLAGCCCCGCCCCWTRGWGCRGVAKPGGGTRAEAGCSPPRPRSVPRCCIGIWAAAATAIQAQGPNLRRKDQTSDQTSEGSHCKSLKSRQVTCQVLVRLTGEGGSSRHVSWQCLMHVDVTGCAMTNCCTSTRAWVQHIQW